jgi:Pectate lyase superfamily protein
MAFTQKTWVIEKNPLGPPANPEKATPIGKSLNELEARIAAAFAEVNGLVFNVKDSAYGAKGNGAADDAAAIQAALNAAKAAGGGIVYFPAGTYIVGETLTQPSSTTLMGAALSVLKLKNGANRNLLQSENTGAGGAERFHIYHLIFDGNKANNASGGVVIDGRCYSTFETEFRNFAGQLKLEFSGEAQPEDDESFLANLRYMNNGGALRFNGPHDSVLTNVMARNSGIAANIEALNTSTWDNAHAYGNTPIGIIAGSNTNWFDCQSEGTTSYKLKITGSGVQWIGGRIFSAGGEDAKKGILIAGGTGHQLRNLLIENCDAAPINFETAGFNTCITGHIYGTEAKPAVIGIPDSASVDTLGLHVAEPMFLCESSIELTSRLLGKRGPLVTSDGNLDIGGRLAYIERATDPSATAAQARVYSKHVNAKTVLKARFGGGADVILAREKLGTLDELASAEELVPEDQGPVTTYKVTGATEIKKIAALRAGLILVLFLTGEAKLTNGENLVLVNSYEGTANRTITLVCDGVNWIEVSRDRAKASLATTLEAKAEKTATTPSSTRNTWVTGQVETATATRTKIKIKVGGGVVQELAISAAATGVSVTPFSFPVPANRSWEWEKVEGTVEANGFKFSNTII